MLGSDTINIDSLLSELERYRNADKSSYFVLRKQIDYSNEYIDVLDYSSSNSPKDEMGNFFKQWNIIIRIKKDFTELDGYKELSRHLDIKVSRVNSGRHTGQHALRIYKMSENPDNGIIKLVLDFIFDQ